jgi:tetratricopeptide (TPR) repeat protein
MMRRMSGPHAALLACCLLGAACGAGSSDPDRRMEDWEPTYDRVEALSRDGRHADAITAGEEYLKKYPDNTDGHLMIADAARQAAEAATDASRQPRFELALTHYSRLLEVSKNPMFRLLAIVGGIQATGAKGLNRPADAERLARLLVAEDPKDIAKYQPLITVLTDAKRYQDVVPVFDEIRANAIVDAKSTARYGGMVHDLVLFTEGFPRDTARPLLAGAVALNEEALATDARSLDLVRNKGMLLRAQAQTEPDPARQRALSDQSRAAFAELDKLEQQ